MPATAPLNYAPRPPRRRRFILPLLLMLMCCVIGFAAWTVWQVWWPQYQQRRAQEQERLRKERLELACRKYTAPRDQVVLEEDSITGQKLLGAGTDYHVSLHDRGGAFHTPQVWKQFWGFATGDGIAFLHERTSPSGHRRIVAISLFGRGGGDDTLGIAYDVIRIIAIGDDGYRVGQGIRSFPFQKPLRLFAGQPDPTDAAHFTIGYVEDGQRGTLDGWLGDDGHIYFYISDGPAKDRINSALDLKPRGRLTSQ